MEHFYGKIGTEKIKINKERVEQIRRSFQLFTLTLSWTSKQIEEVYELLVISMVEMLFEIQDISDI